MKKIMIPVLAAMTALTPLAAGSASALTPRGDNDRYDHRSDNRQERREVRRNARDNGFYNNGRFHRGQPTASQMRARDFRYAERRWQRGERLSAWDRSHYVRVSDYRSHHLRAPPRGYEYRRSNSGEILLAAVATGLILQVLLNQ